MVLMQLRSRLSDDKIKEFATILKDFKAVRWPSVSSVASHTVELQNEASDANKAMETLVRSLRSLLWDEAQLFRDFRAVLPHSQQLLFDDQASKPQKRDAPPAVVTPEVQNKDEHDSAIYRIYLEAT